MNENNVRDLLVDFIECAIEVNANDDPMYPLPYETGDITNISENLDSYLTNDVGLVLEIDGKKFMISVKQVR